MLRVLCCVVCCVLYVVCDGLRVVCCLWFVRVLLFVVVGCYGVVGV